jgi:hypothetical protein
MKGNANAVAETISRLKFSSLLLRKAINLFVFCMNFNIFGQDKLISFTGLIQLCGFSSCGQRKLIAAEGVKRRWQKTSSWGERVRM